MLIKAWFAFMIERAPLQTIRLSHVNSGVREFARSVNCALGHEVDGAEIVEFTVARVRRECVFATRLACESDGAEFWHDGSFLWLRCEPA